MGLQNYSEVLDYDVDECKRESRLMEVLAVAFQEDSDGMAVWYPVLSSFLLF